MIPEQIIQLTESIPYTEEKMGRSDEKVYRFGSRYILKTGRNRETLLSEKEKTDWLAERIGGPRSICFLQENDTFFYLRTCLDAVPLTDERYMKDPVRLCEACAEAVRILRRLDGCECPFLSEGSSGTDFVHGDLCLPNIFFHEDGSFAGFIDTGNAGRGDRHYDYAWLLWSFRYNLGTDRYDAVFREKTGCMTDRNTYDLYIPAELRSLEGI